MSDQLIWVDDVRDQNPAVLRVAFAEGLHPNKRERAESVLQMLANRCRPSAGHRSGSFVGNLTVTRENATEFAHLLERLAKLMPRPREWTDADREALKDLPTRPAKACRTCGAVNP